MCLGVSLNIQFQHKKLREFNKLIVNVSNAFKLVVIIRDRGWGRRVKNTLVIKIISYVTDGVDPLQDHFYFKSRTVKSQSKDNYHFIEIPPLKVIQRRFSFS